MKGLDFMKTFYSVEIEQNSYEDDLFNGTFEECVEYINEREYTREENDVRIAHVVEDGDHIVDDIITEW